MGNKSEEKRWIEKETLEETKNRCPLLSSTQTFLWALCLVTMESEVVIGPSPGRANATIVCHIHSFTVEPSGLSPGTLFSVGIKSVI